MTQGDLIKKSGIAFRTYMRVLAGEQWVEWKTLTALAKALSVEPADLFTITTSLTPTQAAEIHAEIGEVINKHVAYGWREAAREEIMFELFCKDELEEDDGDKGNEETEVDADLENELQMEGDENGVHRD